MCYHRIMCVLRIYYQYFIFFCKMMGIFSKAILQISFRTFRTAKATYKLESRIRSNIFKIYFILFIIACLQDYKLIHQFFIEQAYVPHISLTITPLLIIFYFALPITPTRLIYLYFYHVLL